MVVVYDPDEDAYVEAPGELCIARTAPEDAAEGDICGSPAIGYAGDIPLCGLHRKRLMNWFAEQAVRDREAEIEHELAAFERQKERQNELCRRAAELDRRRLAEYAAVRAGAKSPRSVVYFIRRVSDGMIKIGTTASLRARMATHRRDHGQLQILLVMSGDREEEADAHAMFSAYRAGRTEWFQPAAPLLNWICRVRQSGRYARAQSSGLLLPLPKLRKLLDAAADEENAA